MALVLDSGGLSRLSERTPAALAMIRTFKRAGLWPPIVPSVVLVECLTGRPGATVNRLVKSCNVHTEVSESIARQAGTLRGKARRGSAVDALVVALADPGGTVLTGDVADIRALAAHAAAVHVERA